MRRSSPRISRQKASLRQQASSIFPDLSRACLARRYSGYTKGTCIVCSTCSCLPGPYSSLLRHICKYSANSFANNTKSTKLYKTMRKHINKNNDVVSTQRHRIFCRHNHLYKRFTWHSPLHSTPKSNHAVK